MTNPKHEELVLHGIASNPQTPFELGGANGKTKARLANRGWFDDLKHI